MFSKESRAKTEELNRQILPPDVKIHPFYDRSELVELTTETVEANLLRGMVLVLIVLIFFLVSFRAAVIVALTIPLVSSVRLHRAACPRCRRQSAVHRRHRLRHRHRWHRRDDGEHLPRTGAAGRTGVQAHDVILAAAKDVDRPIFYSVAVILAGYLPIYALTGPAGKLFHPMAETMSFALVGALILTLTLVPVLASYWFKGGVREKPQPGL